MKFVTFATVPTYGTWIHGDERGSVDRKHNLPGTPHILHDQRKEEYSRKQMKGEIYKLDVESRKIVMVSIGEVCDYRKWLLHAAHIRSTHIHIVVSADEKPEKMMNTFKSYASRALNSIELSGY